MVNNSPFFLSIAVFVVCTTLLLPDAHAQMFSIDDPDPQRQRLPGTATLVGAGLEFADFSYQSEGAGENQRLDFTDTVFRLRLESPGLDLGLGFGGGLTGMDDGSYFNLTGRIFNNFPLTRDPSMMIAIPLQLTTDLKLTRRNNSDAEFQQSSLIIGSGIASVFRLGSRVSLRLKATPNYGFSFSQGSLFGGTLFRVDGRSVLQFNEILGRNALFLGYHFDYRRYRIEGNLNDYDFISHSVSVGIGF